MKRTHIDAHPEPTRGTRRNHPPWWHVAAAAATCSLVLVACGSSANKPSSGSGSYNADVKIAQCMRSHGVSDFPDPTAAAAGQGAGGFSIQRTSGSSTFTINGVPMSGPAYTNAAKTCHLAAASQPPPLTGAQKEAMIAKAHCIRTHGVPNFPDPFFGPGGHGVGLRLQAGVNPQAPAFLNASKICANVGANLPGVP